MVRRTLFYLLSLVPLPMLLGGCNVVHLQNARPGSYYSLKKDKRNGIMSMSARCNIGRGKVDVYMTRNSGLNNQTLKNRKTYIMAIHCNGPGEPLTSQELKLLTLPGGHYSINNLKQIQHHGAFVEEKISHTFNPISFMIQPQQITYIGQLELTAHSDSQYDMRLINNAKKDIPAIEKHFPFISKKDIRVAPGVISKNKRTL